MLYLYATVFNNSTRVEKSLESIDKINADHKFLIVDNYSNDGTYEILNELKNKYNIILKRAKCTRGKGRQMAMELAKDELNDKDVFMSFDLDTIYFDNFIKAIEKNIKTLKKNCVFLNSLCYKETNFRVPWMDLNNGEDWERMAHFISLGYNLIGFNNKIMMGENQPVWGSREKRYAIGLSYIRREIKNSIDLFIGWNVNNFRNLKEFLKYTKTHKRIYFFYFIIFLYVRLFKKTYNYSNMLNIFYVKKNAQFREYNNFK